MSFWRSRLAEESRIFNLTNVLDSGQPVSWSGSAGMTVFEDFVSTPIIIYLPVVSSFSHFNQSKQRCVQELR